MLFLACLVIIRSITTYKSFRHQQLYWNPCVSFFSVRCERDDERKTQGARAGESLYLPCPNLNCFEETVNSSYVWFRNLSTTRQVERIGTEESERVHYHQSVLYILWFNLNDTGRYITRWWSHTSHIHAVPNLSDSHLLNIKVLSGKYNFFPCIKNANKQHEV